MPAVVRNKDANGAGGTASARLAPTVMVDNEIIVVVGDSVSAHPPCGVPGGEPHCAATVTVGSGTVTANYISVIRVGDSDSCGHARAAGSSTVTAG